MIKDRLSELKSKRQYTSDVSLDLVPSNSQEEIFFNLEKFSELSEWIRTVRVNIEEMRNIISMPSFYCNFKVIHDEVERKMDHSLGLCKQIYAAVKRLQEELQGEERRGSVLLRIKNTQFPVIMDDYLNAYREHEKFVRCYENKLVNLMKKVSYIPDDKAADMQASNPMSPFLGNILEETERERQELRDIMERRHLQMIELDKSLVEILQLFELISMLVMDQEQSGAGDRALRAGFAKHRSRSAPAGEGPRVPTEGLEVEGSLEQVIEHYAQQASPYADHGAHLLERARENLLKVWKKKTWLLMGAVLILGVVVVLLIIFMIRFKNE